MATKKLTIDKLERVLTQGLTLREPEFHLEKAGNRIVGDIVSSTFKGKRDHERQRLIWDILDSEFGPDSVRLVGMLLAFTPDEWNLNAASAPVSGKMRAG